VRALLALYPSAWRRRYGFEFAALLDAQPPSPALICDIVLGVIDAADGPKWTRWNPVRTGAPTSSRPSRSR
jgi:hypothetical protein